MRPSQRDLRIFRSPAEPMPTPADYAWLVSGAAPWLDRARYDERPQLQQLQSLRKELSAQQAHLVVEQVELREKAVAKFGQEAWRMFFTRQHLEQATDRVTARYKAGRLAGKTSRVVDYCCGIGGDLIEIAAVAPTEGWDASETAQLLATSNLAALERAGACHVHLGNVETTAPGPEMAWHIDPDRRTGGRRSTRVAQSSPGPELIDRWRASSPNAAIKLAPAAIPPEHWQREAELEWISWGRECRQLAAWFGSLATAHDQRRATRLSGECDDSEPPSAASIVGAPGAPCDWADAAGEFLYDPDPAVLAAHLLGALAARHGLRSLGAGGVYLTGDRPVSDPLLTGFRVRECMPLRLELVARRLAEADVGPLEIKKRGIELDPSTVRKRLSRTGGKMGVLVLTRIGRKQVAIVAERL